jgi:hypothetical protein
MCLPREEVNYVYVDWLFITSSLRQLINYICRYEYSKNESYSALECEKRAAVNVFNMFYVGSDPDFMTRANGTIKFSLE